VRRVFLAVVAWTAVATFSGCAHNAAPMGDPMARPLSPPAALVGHCCPDSLPQLPVEVGDTDTWLGPGGTEVSFKDARGCVYWVQRYSNGPVAEDPRAGVSTRPLLQECLHFGCLADRSDWRFLDPDSELAQRVLNALHDWLDRTAPGASFASIKASTKLRYPTDTELKALRVLTVVDGLEKRLCSQRESG